MSLEQTVIDFVKANDETFVNYLYKGLRYLVQRWHQNRVEAEREVDAKLAALAAQRATYDERIAAKPEG